MAGLSLSFSSFFVPELVKFCPFWVFILCVCGTCEISFVKVLIGYLINDVLICSVIVCLMNDDHGNGSGFLISLIGFCWES